MKRTAAEAPAPLVCGTAPCRATVTGSITASARQVNSQRRTCAPLIARGSSWPCSRKGEDRRTAPAETVEAAPWHLHLIRVRITCRRRRPGTEWPPSATAGHRARRPNCGRDRCQQPTSYPMPQRNVNRDIQWRDYRRSEPMQTLVLQRLRTQEGPEASAPDHPDASETLHNPYGPSPARQRRDRGARPA